MPDMLRAILIQRDAMAVDVPLHATVVGCRPAPSPAAEDLFEVFVRARADAPITQRLVYRIPVGEHVPAGAKHFLGLDGRTAYFLDELETHGVVQDE